MDELGVEGLVNHDYGSLFFDHATDIVHSRTMISSPLSFILTFGYYRYRLSDWVLVRYFTEYSDITIFLFGPSPIIFMFPIYGQIAVMSELNMADGDSLNEVNSDREVDANAADADIDDDDVIAAR